MAECVPIAEVYLREDYEIVWMNTIVSDLFWHFHRECNRTKFTPKDKQPRLIGAFSGTEDVYIGSRSEFVELYKNLGDGNRKLMPNCDGCDCPITDHALPREYCCV